MRIVFFGTNTNFSKITLLALAEKFEIVGLVESIYQAKLIKQSRILTLLYKLASTLKRKFTLQKYAIKSNLPFYSLRNIDQSELFLFLKTIRPDLVCSSPSSRLLRREVLTVPTFGAINVHRALLPKYRGGNPIFWQYYNMDPEGGVTVHFIDEGIDTGNIIKQKQIKIRPGMEVKEYLRQTINVAAEILVGAVDDIASGVVTSTEQRNLKGSCAPMIKKNDLIIDWDKWSIERVWHLIRSFENIYSLLPKPKNLPGFYWKKIDNICYRAIPDKHTGKIIFEKSKFYNSHKEGLISISPGFSLKKALTKLLVKGEPF